MSLLHLIFVNERWNFDGFWDHVFVYSWKNIIFSVCEVVVKDIFSKKSPIILSHILYQLWS